MPNANHEDSSQTGADDQSVSPESDGRDDGGPGSHTEGGTGGVANDPASGGVPEEADEDSKTQPE